MEIQRLQNLSLKAMTSLGRSRSQSSRLVLCLIFLRFLRRNTRLSRATSESERMMEFVILSSRLARGTSLKNKFVRDF